ncbi:MAG: PD-(D/E)XK nuclease family protein [Coriobacteriales bacterium]|nr:PD-(D/E)XK nuclease family protein [Coriobacteriales bacterium]
MPLILITGRANAGKSGRLYGALRSSSAQGQEPTLLLPSPADVRRARGEFAASSPLGVRITTFPQWLEYLWGRHGTGRALVTDPIRAAVISSVIEADGAHGLSDSRGLRAMIGKLAGRTSSDPKPVDPSDRTAASIAHLLPGYSTELERRGLIEPARAARELEETGFRLGGPIAVNRFTDLQDWQLSLLKSLSGRGERVSVALTYEAGFRATEATQRLVDEVTPLADSVEHVPDDERGVIHDFSDGLFQSRPPLEPSPHVRFAEAGSIEAEAAIVAAIVKEHVDSGVPPERVAVAFRDMARHAPSLELAMRAEGLEADIQYHSPLGERPLAKALTTLVAAAADRVDAASALSFVGSPYAGPARRDAHEIDVRLRGTVGRTRASDVARALADSGEWGRISVEMARACVTSRGGVGSWKKLASRLAAEAAKTRGGGLLDPATARDCRTLSRLLSVMDELGALPTPADPADVLAAIEGSSVGEGSGERAGAVQCLTLEGLRSRRFDVIVLGGLTADEFSSERGEPLVVGVARRLGMSVGTPSRLVERQLFYLATSRARDSLVMVRRTADDRGQAMRPSPFWGESLSRFGVDDSADLETSGLVYQRWDARELAVSAPAIHFDRRADRERAVAGCGPEAVARGVLSPSGRDRLGKRNSPFSASELEAWLACPYRWFLHYVVRPSEIEREVDAAALGTLAHDVLAEFYRRWTIEGPRRVTKATLAEALAEFDRAASGVLESEEDAVLSLSDELNRARAVERARRVVIDDVGCLPSMVPARFEEQFGGVDGLDFGGVPVRGRIDRVDVGPHEAVVTDYKTGGGGSNWRSWAKDGVIQMPMYMAMCERVTGTPVIGGLYRSLSTGEVKGVWAGDDLPGGVEPSAMLGDDVDVPTLIADAAERATRAAQGIVAGDIERRPRNAAACSYCHLNRVCDAS